MYQGQMLSIGENVSSYVKMEGGNYYGDAGELTIAADHRVVQ